MTRREARRLREAEEAARRAAHVDDSAAPTQPGAAVTSAHDADGSPRAAAAPAPSEAAANPAGIAQPSADTARRAGDDPRPATGGEPVAGGRPDAETTPATRATAVAAGRGRPPRTVGEPPPGTRDGERRSVEPSAGPTAGLPPEPAPQASPVPQASPAAQTSPAPITAAAPGARPAPPRPVREPTPVPAAPEHEEPAGFVRPGPAHPPKGLRGLLYRITGGAVNIGPSERERREELLERQIARRLEGSWNTAFLSLKGGIGKTSTTVGVGLTLAELRPEPPCAIDANPDAGDLVERALGEGAYESERSRSITSLLRDFGSVTSRARLVSYLHQAGSLHLLAGEQDPELSDSLTAEDYRRVHALVARHFGVTLTDCGTGVSRPAMRGILQEADNIVVVAGYAVSGAKRARDTLRWLSAHGYDRLAKGAIVVVTDKDDVSARVDKGAIESTLSGLCRALITVPHDRSMADGDLVSLPALRPETRQAYREIAAAIVSGYRR
ncbi:MinD/ParA family ATP-binding protein [Sinomonas sp. B1-1]|uniref:MinD/ParA family ATP-binding protein n=1 Tax=Sinomonas sp. B1-1 TaxID=3141454 RepID=UPI003D2D5550